MGRAETTPEQAAWSGDRVLSDVRMTAPTPQLVARLRSARQAENCAVFGQLQAIADLYESCRPTEQRRQEDRRRGRRDTSAQSLHESLVVTETAVALGMTETAAGRRVDAALALLVEGRLPLAARLSAVGMLDWTRINILVMRTRDLTLEQARAVESAVLTDRALRLTVGRFENEVDRAVLAADPEAVEKRRRAARADRKVTFWKVRDGAGTLDGRAELCIAGPAESLRAAWVSLDAAARRLRADGDPRTLDQLRHDLAVAGCVTGLLPVPQDVLPGESTGEQRSGAASDGEAVVTVAARPDVPVHVTVTVALETLLGLNEQPALLDGYGPVTAAMARDLARDGIWRCAAVDDTHGTVLGLGRRTFTPGYVPGANLRAFVAAAAPTCQVPWCNAAVERCDLDHRVPHAEGGATCSCTVGPLCRRHHRQKSAGHLTGEPSTDPHHPPGTTVWTTSGGQRVVVLPYAPLPPDAYRAETAGVDGQDGEPAERSAGDPAEAWCARARGGPEAVARVVADDPPPF